MVQTPNANRIHIGIYGKRNAGKSTLINLLTNQKAALVSAVAGTTTDPVYQQMEVKGLGPCVFIDTAGFDDVEDLGALRVEKTRDTLKKIDLAILVLCQQDTALEQAWYETLTKKKIPVILVLSKSDLQKGSTAFQKLLEQQFSRPILPVSQQNPSSVKQVIGALVSNLPEDFESPSITGHLVSAGDVVVLVMPQDMAAPKGRLILPQVQTTRDLLDHHCVVISCTLDTLPQALSSLTKPPHLIITDSQVFSAVFQQKPKESMLTSFSVLFAKYKGDIETFISSAKTIDTLTPNSRVLIAESCTHAPLEEDIGRVKIPALLRKKYGETLDIQLVSGADFPTDVSGYDLIIHCGACMFNRKHVLHRIAQAKEQHVPITNYGITIAHLTGILEHIEW